MLKSWAMKFELEIFQAKDGRYQSRCSIMGVGDIDIGLLVNTFGEPIHHLREVGINFLRSQAAVLAADSLE